jgi:hypothetical protein
MGVMKCLSGLRSPSHNVIRRGQLSSITEIPEPLAERILLEAFENNHAIVLVEEFDNMRVRAQAVVDGAFNVKLASTFVGAARSLDNGLIR